MNRIFSDEPEKRKFIISELKEFTEQGDMSRLANSLNSVLVTPHQRTLLNDIKPFIPVKQQALFDHLTSLHNSSMIFNKTSMQLPPQTPPPPPPPPHEPSASVHNIPSPKQSFVDEAERYYQPKYAFKPDSGKR